MYLYSLLNKYKIICIVASSKIQQILSHFMFLIKHYIITVYFSFQMKCELENHLLSRSFRFMDWTAPSALLQFCFGNSTEIWQLSVHLSCSKAESVTPKREKAWLLSINGQSTWLGKETKSKIKCTMEQGVFFFFLSFFFGQECVIIILCDEDFLRSNCSTRFNWRTAKCPEY